MTLTPDDLSALRQLIITTVQPMIDRSIVAAIDELSIMIAAGFSELHDKFDRQEQRLAIKASRNENQDQEIGPIGHDIRAALHAA